MILFQYFRDLLYMELVRIPVLSYILNEILIFIYPEDAALKLTPPPQK